VNVIVPFGQVRPARSAQIWLKDEVKVDTIKFFSILWQNLAEKSRREKSWLQDRISGILGGLMEWEKGTG